MAEAGHTKLLMPYRVLDGFLAPDEHAALLAWAIENEPRFKPAQLAGGLVEPSVRRSFSLRDLGPLAPLVRQHIERAVPGWIAELRVTPFVTSDIELELVAHNEGAHFARHSDIYTSDMKARGDRMLSAVYYFHREPAGFSGGCLRLHRFGAEAGEAGSVDITPSQNRLVVFPSWGPHEVMPVACPSAAFADSRFAVNCWVYRARREK